MALPLLAGIAVGSLAVIAFNNRGEIKEKLSEGAQKAKEVAEAGYEKAKEVTSDVTEKAKEKLACRSCDEAVEEKNEDKKEV